MKSGTTSLYSDLARHPSVVSLSRKEPTFFSSDERFGRGENWYHSLCETSTKSKWIVDGSTDCSKYPYCGDVPARLRAYGANVKLLYIMRHPVRRLESHARHVARLKREVNAITSDRPDHSLDSGPSDVAWAVSDYAMQIDQFREWYDRGDMLLVTMEEYQADPSKVVARAIAFLGLPATPYPEVSSTKLNRGDGFMRPSKRNIIYFMFFSLLYISIYEFSKSKKIAKS